MKLQEIRYYYSNMERSRILPKHKFSVKHMHYYGITHSLKNRTGPPVQPEKTGTGASAGSLSALDRSRQWAGINRSNRGRTAGFHVKPGIRSDRFDCHSVRKIDASGIRTQHLSCTSNASLGWPTDQRLLCVRSTDSPSFHRIYTVALQCPVLSHGFVYLFFTN